MVTKGFKQLVAEANAAVETIPVAQAQEAIGDPGTVFAAAGPAPASNASRPSRTSDNRGRNTIRPRLSRIARYADAVLEAHPGVTLGLGSMGARMQAMREAGVDAVVLIGQVPRPDVSKLELDAGAMAMLPAIIASLPQGDVAEAAANAALKRL